MKADEINQNKEKKSFWKTTIGIITTITAIIGASTALIIAIKNFNTAVNPPDSGSSTPITAPTTGGSDGSVTEQKVLPVDTVSIRLIEKKPNVSISAFSISPSEITLDKDSKPKSFTAILEAFNSGDRLAENCVFTLISDGGIIGNASSESFSLDPNTKKQVVINATISNSGKITAKLFCSNDTEKSTSPANISVYAYGTVHGIIPKTQ